jgi:predicted AAA+ superfamily ATPase
MAETPINSSGLSQTAQVLLDYLLRYERQKGVRLPAQALERNLSGAYPLFRYLFPDGRVLQAAMEELDRTGCLQVSQSLSNVKLMERLMRSVLDHIRLQCPEIVERIPLRHIGDVVASAPDDPNVALLNERLQFLDQSGFYAAAPLATQYQRALLEIGRSDREKRALIERIAELVAMKPIEAVPLPASCNLPSGWYASSDFVPNTRFRVAIALLNCHGDIESQFLAAQELADLCKDTSLVFVLMGQNSEVDQRMSDLCIKNYAVLMRENDLKRIVLSTDRQRSMRECMFPQLPPSTISPFRYVGPVTGDRFVGRKVELYRILNALTTSFTITGARTIGKTSLLHTIRDHVNKDPARDSTLAVFVDATHDHQLEHFQKNLMQALSRGAKQRGMEIDRIDPGHEFFEDLSTVLRKSARQYLFLIDEVDNLIQDSEFAEFEELVRTLSNIGCARFVLSGYKNLRERTMNRESYFYNLFESITLSPLTRGEALDLVCSQMVRVYVEFENDQVIESILELGSTFAAYLQHMCHLLLKRLDESGRDRIIRLEDVRAVYDGEEFTNAIISAVTESLGQTSALLERLILYWAAASRSPSFSERELLEGLSKHLYLPRQTEVQKALQYLTATYLLAQSGGRYHFCMTHLRDKLRQTEDDMEFTISRFAQEYREFGARVS